MNIPQFSNFPTEGHLGSFQFSIIMNFILQVFCECIFYMVSWVNNSVEWQGCRVGVYLIFKKLPNLFPKWSYCISLSPAVYKNSSCSISSLKFNDVSFYTLATLVGCSSISLWIQKIQKICIFWWLMMLRTFHCLLLAIYIYFVKNLFQIFSLFFELLVFLLLTCIFSKNGCQSFVR